ncbi:MAG TPA: electron transfer flavoprotein subunit beta/FixA family protein [Anaerohalosphaeraceae bacterium]|nr:electron transfer flavoprotein subunit beta/FixA family protein [Anaerohalosphaeraceae bacterium]
MAYNCVVLVKQVPDTKRITGQAMNEDGTVNRAALPAIFNPEDLNALELALNIKDQFGGTVTVMTMGLPAAAEVLRQGLYRGADRAILITDRRCAASDTLATSYILSCGVKKLNPDIVLCGRQAIDGDTAQVGPQCAEKLGIPQITYVEELIKLDGKTIVVKRNLGNGWQEVKGRLPVLLTVLDTANEPRVCCAKRLMKCKTAACGPEVETQIRAANPGASDEQVKAMAKQQGELLKQKGLLIEQWDLDMLNADLQWCGRDGSPTKVHRIQSVVLTAKESKSVEPTQAGVDAMIHELIVDHTLG